MKKIRLFTLFFLFVICTGLYSQSGNSNPFYKGSGEKEITASRTGGLIGCVSSLQKNINNRISEIINNYKKEKENTLLLYIAGFAFLYGFIHAMTPGHGKNIILGWILSSERTFIKVLLTSVTGMFFHVFNSVIMIYIILYFIKDRISVQSPVFIKYFSFAAFILILIIALKGITDLFRKKDSHIHMNNLEKINSSTSLKECIVISAGIGLVPCPVAAILTVFMISGKLYAESILTASFFFSGMALTLIIYSSAVWALRSSITSIKNNRLKKIRDIFLPLSGSVLLILSGFFIILPYISF